MACRTAHLEFVEGGTLGGAVVQTQQFREGREPRHIEPTSAKGFTARVATPASTAPDARQRGEVGTGNASANV